MQLLCKEEFLGKPQHNREQEHEQNLKLMASIAIANIKHSPASSRINRTSL